MFPRADAPALTVLTQNIRMDTGETAPEDPDHWPSRAPVLVELLRDADADVVGTQEVLRSQIPVLDQALGESHLRLGIGREGGDHGEHNLLFLRRDRFDVLEWDQVWLSEQPRLVGSLGWDAHCPRILVHARVRDRISGTDLVVAVTHLDHAGALARDKSAGVIAQRLREVADGAPELLMGDFNCAGGDSNPWRVLRDAGYEDAHDTAQERIGEDTGTFPEYGPPQPGGERIDWIMARGLTIDSYAAHDHVIDGVHASDHACVQAVVQKEVRSEGSRSAASLALG